MVKGYFTSFYFDDKVTGQNLPLKEQRGNVVMLEVPGARYPTTIISSASAPFLVPRFA